MAKKTVDNFAKNFDSEVSSRSFSIDVTSSLICAQDPFYYNPQHPQQGQGDTSEKQKKGRVFKNYKGKKMYIPPGLNPSDRNHAHDIKILASVRRRAWHLDMSLFHWCGFRFGWSVIIGLVPV